MDDVKATAGLTLTMGKGRSRHDVLIGRIDLPQIQQALKRTAVEVPATINDEGYLLAVNANEVVVAGKSAAGTFYGLQTLKQLVRGDTREAIASGSRPQWPFIPGLKIADWPTMRWRAVSDDISRGPVPTVDYIKRQIRTEAFFKLDMHSFYMEHTFASESHRLSCTAGGSLTPNEIRELVATARRYHVELVLSNSLRHLHKALRLEKICRLAETALRRRAFAAAGRKYKLIAIVLAS